MDDKQIADALAPILMAEYKAHTGLKTVGPFEGKLSDILIWLRSMGATWSKILAFIGPIIQLLLSGGTMNWQAVLDAIMAIFFPPKPPVPGPAPAQP